MRINTESVLYMCCCVQDQLLFVKHPLELFPVLLFRMTTLAAAGSDATQASAGHLCSPLIGPRLPRLASDWLMAGDLSSGQSGACLPGSRLTPQHMCDALTTGGGG